MEQESPHAKAHRSPVIARTAYRAALAGPDLDHRRSHLGKPAYPVERALLDDCGGGWRAARPGTQTIRLFFDEPQDVKRILLCFVETAAARTHEFALRWSNGTDGLKEIVRQQWNFSPNGATSENEDYDVALRSVRVLELTINPDISRADAYATMSRFRLA